MITHVWNMCKTLPEHVRDTSGMHAIRVCASTKPCDNAAARFT